MQEVRRVVWGFCTQEGFRPESLRCAVHIASDWLVAGGKIRRVGSDPAIAGAEIKESLRCGWHGMAAVKSLGGAAAAAVKETSLRCMPVNPSMARRRAAEGLTPELRRTLERHASIGSTATTLRQMYALGLRSNREKLLLGAQFLHAELPIRLAHRVLELENLPYDLNKMPSVIKVRQLYESSFIDLINTKRPEDEDEEDIFTDLSIRIRSRHDDVVTLMAKGCLELKEYCGKTAQDLKIHTFLDRFYRSRIGIRTLISHQADMKYSREGYVGSINPNCRPADVAQEAVYAVQSIAHRTYEDCPEVQIVGDTDLQFPYVEGHIFFCIFELLKNSIRATIETHRYADTLPPVKVVIADGREDVTIKISDEGGGIPRSGIDRIWTYLFTTAKIPPDKLIEMEERSRHGGVGFDPIAGFGYGLPLSRIHARYFRGDLNIMSMEGYGTDAYLHLCKLWNKREDIR